jgi:hypothetical protein
MALVTVHLASSHYIFVVNALNVGNGVTRDDMPFVSNTRQFDLVVCIILTTEINKRKDRL